MKISKMMQWISITLLCLCLSACVQSEQPSAKQESEAEQYEEFSWPKEGITNMLPVPKSTTGKIYTMDEQILTIYVSNTYASDFRNYIRACQNMGFDVDETSNEGRFSAYNENGTHLVLSFDDDDFVMRIDLTLSQEDQQENTASISKSEPDAQEAKEEDATDFQNDMDDYEEFFLEYCNFMRSYNESDAQKSMKKQYDSYQKEKQEKLDALDAIGKMDLSEEKQEIYDLSMKHINRLLEMAEY